MQTSRDKESSQERDKRLKKMNEYNVASRSSETPRLTRGRLQKKRNDNALLKSKQTDDEKKEEQEKNKQRQTKSRARKQLFPAVNDTFKSAFTKPGDDLPEPWDIGEFRLKENQCPDCEAYAFAGREVRDRKCCSHGRVKLQTFDVGYPPILKQYFTEKYHPAFKHMREKGRRYNSLVAPMARSVEIIREPHEGKVSHGPPFYKIKGVIDYLMGPLYPSANPL